MFDLSVEFVRYGALLVSINGSPVTIKRVSFSFQIKFSSLSHMLTDSCNSIVKILCTINMLKTNFSLFSLFSFIWFEFSLEFDLFFSSSFEQFWLFCKLWTLKSGINWIATVLFWINGFVRSSYIYLFFFSLYLSSTSQWIDERIFKSQILTFIWKDFISLCIEDQHINGKMYYLLFKKWTHPEYSWW